MLWILSCALLILLGFWGWTRKKTETGTYYVRCVTARDQARSYPWSGPHASEKEAKEEMADSRRLIGKRDVLFIIKGDP